ncbi:ISLre2 family transposase [Brevibacillus agri]|uniref:ISLre2 family transposase n=1 Tax=Brevibacillus agri TaxID=51101 RepID=UPI001C8D222B|nr:ISLre2 family transposase [Brevibacillus agri]MBY0053098.1 ISLre2 family transposase [Brevibacillus agri]
MKENTTSYPNLKELEQMVWRNLQETYSTVMVALLTDLDEQIAKERDVKRYRLQDKRVLTIYSLFGKVEVKRNYYLDRETGEYVYLLDRYLEFEGAGAFSPLVEEAAIEMAVTGSSYRKAADTLETLVGYRVISHEAIRQHLLKVEVIQKERQPVIRPVLFVEVDGLYLKRQEKGKKGKEEKIAAIHQGWEINGKRVSLKGKRHYVHQGKEPFWEGLETFLMDIFDYDPAVHLLVINGDGANWITACREYFGGRAFFSIDRFHVAREIRRIFREHPRYRAMQKALASYNGEKLITELNSAVGTLDTEAKEKRLEELIDQLKQYPEALGDYRDWLKEKGIDTEGMRPMGSAEATMSVFAKRLKNGRSWVEKGKSAMITALVAHLDQLGLKTLFGRVEKWTEAKKEDKPARYYLEKVTRTVGEMTRDNIRYLKGKVNIPVYLALKALRGF